MGKSAGAVIVRDQGTGISLCCKPTTTSADDYPSLRLHSVLVGELCDCMDTQLVEPAFCYPHDVSNLADEEVVFRLL
jgi:hypothetical protein